VTPFHDFRSALYSLFTTQVVQIKRRIDAKPENPGHTVTDHR
jgi:hypothetical protein